MATYEFADAKINFETFKVTVNDEPVRMTQLELSLLRYFVENEGRVIPRRELLENVWGMPGNLNTRAPDQFIRRLRKIFEPDPAQPRHFLTIRDAGYRFVAAGEEESSPLPPGGQVSVRRTHPRWICRGGQCPSYDKLEHATELIACEILFRELCAAVARSPTRSTWSSCPRACTTSGRRACRRGSRRC